MAESNGRVAGAGRATPHERLLAKYDVTPDPGGTVMCSADPGSSPYWNTLLSRKFGQDWPNAYMSTSDQVPFGDTGITNRELRARGGHDPEVTRGEPKNGTYY